MLVKLTAEDGYPIWIAVRHVVSIVRRGNGSAISMTDTVIEYVRESPTEVAELLGGNQQGD